MIFFFDRERKRERFRLVNVRKREKMEINQPKKSQHWSEERREGEKEREGRSIGTLNISFASFNFQLMRDIRRRRRHTASRKSHSSLIEKKRDNEFKNTARRKKRNHLLSSWGPVGIGKLREKNGEQSRSSCT